METKKLKWIPIGIITGIAIMMINNTIMKKSAELGEKVPEHHVFTSQIIQQNIAPQIKGYGNVVAKNTWQAISEVSGKVVYLNPQLQRGTFISAGEVLLKIDPTSYQIALNKAQANLASTQAEKDQLDIEQQRLQRSLAIEQKNLKLEEKEFKRLKSLNKKGSVSISELEKQERDYFSKQLKVNDIQAQVKQLPFKFNALIAQISQSQSQVEQAQLDLSHTIFTMPFAGRIIDVSAEQQQVVSIGEKLILAHDISKLEVEAKIPTRQLAKLLDSVKKSNPNFTKVTTVPDIKNANLSAQILLRNATTEKEWQGRVTRIIGEIDNRIGTAGLVIEVDFDFLKFIQQNKTADIPLLSGMFVEVVINGFPQPYLTVPVVALHNDNLYLVDDKQRLVIKPVDVLFIREQTAAITSEDLSATQQIVISDVVPVATGLKLKTTDWQEGK